MDLIGEEKRIQALFREIKAQDDELAPPFTRTWNIVEARFGLAHLEPAALRAALTFPRLIAAALVISCLVTVVVDRSWRLPSQPVSQTLVSTGNAVPTLEGSIKPTSETGTSSPPKIQKRKGSIRRADRVSGKALMARSNYREVKRIKLSLWQSPTAGLLRYPGDELLKNSPPLNHSVSEMRGFLSN